MNNAYCGVLNYRQVSKSLIKCEGGVKFSDLELLTIFAPDDLMEYESLFFNQIESLNELDQLLDSNTSVLEKLNSDVNDLKLKIFYMNELEIDVQNSLWWLDNRVKEIESQSETDKNVLKESEFDNTNDRQHMYRLIDYYQKVKATMENLIEEFNETHNLYTNEFNECFPLKSLIENMFEILENTYTNIEQMDVKLISLSNTITDVMKEKENKVQ